MPTLAEVLAKSSTRRSTGLGLSSGRVGLSSGRQQPTLEELQAQVAELEGVSAETGARGIEQDKPGVFRTLIDLLSRPNYSIAGFFEEVASEQPSVTRGVKRALTEMFSGIGGLEGEKRAFGEVFENLGMGTATLAQAFPALEGTWVGNFGTRGAAGLAADIFTDPLTYMGAGAARKALRVIAGGKEVSLTDKGLDAFNRVLKSEKVSDDLAALGSKADPFRLGISGQEAKRFELAEKEFAKRFGDTLPKDFVDQGGLKFFGKTLVAGERFSDMNSGVAKAIRSVPGGDYTLGKVAGFSRSMQKGINELFGGMGHLPELQSSGMKAEAIRLKRMFNSATGAHRQRIRGILDHGNEHLGIAPSLAKRWQKAVAKDEGLGKKFYDIREGTGSHALTTDQQQMFDEFAKLYDTMGVDLVEAGVFEAGGLIQGKYFHHAYTRESAKGLEQYHANLGTQFRGAINEGITKERPFRTYESAIENSKRMNALQSELYPVLVPEYDVLANMNKYVDQYADMIGRKAWHEEAMAKFGADPALWDKNINWINLTGRLVSPKDAALIRSVMGAKDPFGKFTKEIRFEEASQAVGKLSGDGKSELLGTMIENAKSPAETLKVVNFADEKGISKYLPEMHVTEGEMGGGAYEKMFGEAARPVRRSGSMWGDKEIMIPEIIAKDIETMNSGIFNTKDWPTFRRNLQRFDTFTNYFKAGNYTFFPASHFRNIYSNVTQSFLDIGLGALDPRTHREAAAIMAGKGLDVASIGGYTRGEIRKMFRDFGIWVPGRTFVEATGKKRLGRAAGRAADIAGVVENEARIVLALQNMRRGIHPRQAADHVGEFLFHYNELSKFEREVMRRVFPFYTWFRKNITLQARALARTPGRVINPIKAFRGYTDENDHMVEWEGEALKARLDRDGKTLHMITGIDMPLRGLDTIWKGSAAETGRGIVGMMNPLIKTVPELLLNQDFFLGRNLNRKESGAIGRFIEVAGTPQPVKDWLGYKKRVDEAGRPRYTFDGGRFKLLLQSWIFSRVISTSDRQFRDNIPQGDPNTSAMILDLVTGLRAKSVNMDDQMYRRTQNRIRNSSSLRYAEATSANT